MIIPDEESPKPGEPYGYFIEGPIDEDTLTHMMRVYHAVECEDGPWSIQPVPHGFMVPWPHLRIVAPGSDGEVVAAIASTSAAADCIAMMREAFPMLVREIRDLRSALYDAAKADLTRAVQQPPYDALLEACNRQSEQIALYKYEIEEARAHADYLEASLHRER